MSRIFRGFFIVWTVLRFGLDELVLSSFEKPWIRLLTRIVSVGRNLIPGGSGGSGGCRTTAQDGACRALVAGISHQPVACRNGRSSCRVRCSV